MFLCDQFEKKFKIKSLIEINEEQLFRFFKDMREGIIKRKDNKKYKSVADYIKVFKTFWHWHQKVNGKNGKDISDITIDLDSRYEKNELK